MREWQTACINKGWFDCILVPLLWFIVGVTILFFYTWKPAYGDELSFKRVYEFVETCTVTVNERQCNTKRSITTTENREATMLPVPNPILDQFMLRRFNSDDNLDTYNARLSQ